MSRGELWSFLRSVMLQGQDIALDYRDKGYEEMSARLDAAASERADKLHAMLNGQTFVTPSETKGNQAEAGARKDTEITAPTPRGSLPNSLGGSIEMVIWSCSKCGAIQSFPYNEQPLAYFKCLMGTPNRTMCGGIIKPDSAPQSDRASKP